LGEREGKWRIERDRNGETSFTDGDWKFEEPNNLRIQLGYNQFLKGLSPLLYNSDATDTPKLTTKIQVQLSVKRQRI